VPRPRWSAGKSSGCGITVEWKNLKEKKKKKPRKLIHDDATCPRSDCLWSSLSSPVTFVYGCLIRRGDASAGNELGRTFEGWSKWSIGSIVVGDGVFEGAVSIGCHRKFPAMKRCHGLWSTSGDESHNNIVNGYPLTRPSSSVVPTHHWRVTRMECSLLLYFMPNTVYISHEGLNQNWYFSLIYVKQNVFVPYCWNAHIKLHVSKI
jgi:hypothetical protein